ncbi:hypothetical protein [Terrisporobacter sp.]|uniref:hypothetical protein n=2 Tax=Terrisporobacter sp. TaxID=1965305 RepID=UPI002A8144ED|nr:hypothetical protein [Terrisporobacter sp.]MDY4736694.1 hypothetical protein [Terrisporobacter sp.]
MGIRYNIVPTKVNLEEIEEIQKLHEEVEEFIEAIYIKDNEAIISEAFDIIQVVTNLMLQHKGIKVQEIREGNIEHIHKIDTYIKTKKHQMEYMDEKEYR